MTELQASTGPDDEAVAPVRRWESWRRGVQVTVTLLLLVALLVAAKWVTDPSVSPLRLARIEGDLKHLKRADLEQAVAESIRDSFFTVDVQAVKQAAEALPWVDRVSVRRVWPDTLHLWVVEQVPLARWGETALVNAEGVVFKPKQDSIPQALPLLHGPEDSARELIERYHHLQGLLKSAQMAVAELHLSERRGWRLRTHEGIELHLGRDDIEGRMARWLGVYPLLRDSREQQMQRVDLRYPNGMAVLWVDKSMEAKSAS